MLWFETGVHRVFGGDGSLVTRVISMFAESDDVVKYRSNFGPEGSEMSFVVIKLREHLVE